MTSRAGRVRPVPRRRLLAGALALVALLAGVAGLAEWLRHPPAIQPVPEPYDADDPREEVACPPPPRGPAPPRVSSNDLYDCPHLFDGQTVTYEGEVVGAVLRRANGAWVQLNDDAYAGDLGPLPAHREFRGGNAGVGVHLPATVADQIQWVGSHGARGDVLEVTGTYRQSDPDSGEMAVVLAEQGRLAGRGAAITHPPLRDRQIVGGFLAVAALALLGVGRLAASRR